MALTKIGEWNSPVSAEADRPNRPATDMKAVFDANSNQIKEAFNNLVDAVQAGGADMTFSQAGSRANIASGESMATILGKISKFFADAELAVSTVDVDITHADRYLSMDGTYSVPDVGEAANGVVMGGTTGQIYQKASEDDYDGQWVDVDEAGAILSSTKGTANGVAELDANTKLKADQASSRIVTKYASFTLASGQEGCFIKVSSSSDLTVTIPANVFATGTEIEIMRYGTGKVTIAAASGVTMRSPNGFDELTDQYNVACLKCIGTNEWILAGDLS